MTTPNILLALTKFTQGLQEVQRDIEGLGKCTTLMQSYSTYAQTLWDPEKQIESFKAICKDGGDLDLLDLLLGEDGVDPSLEIIMQFLLRVNMDILLSWNVSCRILV